MGSPRDQMFLRQMTVYSTDAPNTAGIVYGVEKNGSVVGGATLTQGAGAIQVTAAFDLFIGTPQWSLSVRANGQAGITDMPDNVVLKLTFAVQT